MDSLEQIAQEAAIRAERKYTEAMSALSEADRQVIATHIAFAFLHARMRQFAGSMHQNRMPVRVLAQGLTFTVNTVGRQTSCSLALGLDHIYIQCWGDPVRGFWSERWEAPSGTEPSLIWPATNELAERLARHLTQ